MRYCIHSLIFLFLYSLALALSVNICFAQSDRDASKRVGSTYVITNATITLFPGNTVKNQNLLFEDGIIKAIGKNINIPPEAQKIKGDSLFVYAGLIDMANKTGVINPELPEKPGDFDPSDPIPELAGIHPHFNALDKYHKGNDQDEAWRKLGITLSQKLPKGQGMLPGSTAVILYGSPQNNNVLKPKNALYAKFSNVGGVYPNTDLGIMAKWRDLMRNTEIYQKHNLIFANNPGVPRRENNKVLDALAPLMENGLPVIFETSDELDMRRAIGLAEEYRLNLILTGIKEGESLIPVIKNSNVQAVLTIDLPKDQFTTEPKDDVELSADYQSRKEWSLQAYKKAVSLAGEYERAGIPFGFTTKHLARGDLFKNINTMIENGLSEEGALAAFTINPAKILELEHLVGSLEVGKMANMVILTDTIFKEEAEIVYTISDGYVFDYTEEIKNDAKKEGSMTWEYTADTNVGESKGTWVFVKKEDKWEGTITYDNPDGDGTTQSDITDLIITEEVMEFQFTVTVSGNSLDVKVTGNISVNDFYGSMDILNHGSFEVTARKKENPDKK